MILLNSKKPPKGMSKIKFMPFSAVFPLKAKDNLTSVSVLALGFLN